MDGHSSHYTADLLEYCMANNIEVLGYPPHCMHALQGLGIICFTKMEEAWKNQIDQFEILHQRGIGKEDFCQVFGEAFLKAFTPETITAAYKATGIHPFNPNVIKPTQMKPSENTSTQASFPQPQTSPTCVVMVAFCDYSFTTQGTRPDSPPVAGPSTFSGSLSNPILVAADTNLLITPSKHCDPASNPDLATQSKLSGLALQTLHQDRF